LLVLGIAQARGDPLPSEHPATPDSSFAASGNALVSAGRESTLFITFYFAAMLALLTSTIWVKLRARYR
jgi:hypothetical protein